MNVKEKKVFVNDLIRCIKTIIDSKIERLPDDWDGYELRWFIKDHFDEAVWHMARDKRKGRYQNYKNFRIVNGL